MRRTLLNDGWTVRPKSNRFEERLGSGQPGTPVTLPHDALLGSPRLPGGNAATAFSTGGEFGEPQCTTFDGRALAVVRPTGPGAITITATAAGCEPVHAHVHAS